MLHASLAAWRTARGWRGVLLRGASGAGKSDLVLRLSQVGWRLVADDRVLAWSSGARPFGRAPESLAGLVELRGQGMARVVPLALCEITLAVDLAEPPERQPAPDLAEVAGLRVPRHTLRPWDASAPARLRRLVESL